MADGFSVITQGESTPPEEKGSGGSSDWYGSAAPDESGDKKRYMQSYLQVIMNLYGKYAMTPKQQQLAMKAFAMRASPSVYGEMLRRFDPKYATTIDFKDRMQEARDLYQQYRPGRPVPADFMTKYARSGMSLARLQERIEKSKWFKRDFAGWTEAQRAGSPAGYSPQTFLNYRTMWNRALERAYGRGATRLEQRMMFDSAMTPDEIGSNFTELFGGKEALKWATGIEMGRNAMVKGVLSGKYGTAALDKTRQARQATAGYMNSRNRGFDIGADEVTKNITMSRI